MEEVEGRVCGLLYLGWVFDLESILMEVEGMFATVAAMSLAITWCMACQGQEAYCFSDYYDLPLECIWFVSASLSYVRVPF